jgi:penicillin-insensitive murein endopeptidase
MQPAVHLLVGLWLTVSPAWSGLLPPSTPDAAAVEVRADRRDSRHDGKDATLLALTDDELQQRIEEDPGSLGSLSIGRPGSAFLVNGVSLPSSPQWEVAPNAESWGTAETMEAIRIAVDTVCALFPETPAIVIGDISGPNGGRLKRHESHQGGRDVDFGFYFKEGTAAWPAPGTAKNLDLPRNWALVRALVARTDVELILLDRRIQKLLYDYALRIGEERAFLDRVFQTARGFRDAAVKHLSGHRNHYHVRFYNQVAQELGRRAHPLLVQAGLVQPPVYTVRHLVRPGQTIGHLAARYGTSTRAIMQANGLRSTQLRAGRSYRIPVRRALPALEPVVVPRRILPAVTPDALAGVEWPTPETLYGESWVPGATSGQ